MDFLEGNQTNANEDMHCSVVSYRFLVFLSSDTTAVQHWRDGNFFSELNSLNSMTLTPMFMVLFFYT